MPSFLGQKRSVPKLSLFNPAKSCNASKAVLLKDPVDLTTPYK